MKKNVGMTDRAVRIVIAAILVILYFSGVVTGTAGMTLLIVAAILLITGLFRICGLYALLGINTCPNQRKKE
ncbi:YgaP family membrane protein [Geofilum rubicundum]|uniref:Inner membrane protein YgaP-like transmembrane domain-containing protein n=1 Tax=Geofilum rubicundum JCM 15548 TaxID=1236989 RepID=A0A0E9LXP8_9BACT|nr:DUF2892 domain-containing protein [Geofilum rubicundum]GAO29645.1 hypothetical protein JCM15548_11856 [Geofilum rubicundum JCM 15548]